MIAKELLNPRSIVVVGASADVQKPGGKVLKNLLDSNFKGTFSNYGGQIIDLLLVVTDSTSIDDVEEEMNPAFEGIYDLNGRKLNEITKTGIYIVNGKKVFIKK